MTFRLTIALDEVKDISAKKRKLMHQSQFIVDSEIEALLYYGRVDEVFQKVAKEQWGKLK